jgi:hypothetical protein
MAAGSLAKKEHGEYAPIADKRKYSFIAWAKALLCAPLAFFVFGLFFFSFTGQVLFLKTVHTEKDFKRFILGFLKLFAMTVIGTLLYFLFFFVVACLLSYWVGTGVINGT